MPLDEATLEQAAEDGSIDHMKWPAILGPLLERLSHIVYNDFVSPQPYPIINPVLPSQLHSSTSEQTPEQAVALTTQSPSTPRTLPPVPPFPGSSASHVPDSQPLPSSASPSEPELPLPLQQIFDSVNHNLQTVFAQKPPHTIQRLSELVLRPRDHYKTLPAWLRAVDRVVSVSSTSDIFPLSDVPLQLNGVNANNGGGILWNNNNDVRNGYDRDALGSDESLGGALLTPIPWLANSNTSVPTHEDSNAKVEGWRDGVDDLLGDPIDPEAAAADAQALALVAEEHADNPLVPERKDGAVTQGELIRMEQEAGVVPVSHLGTAPNIDGEAVIGGDFDDEGDSMPPHARGPDVVGTVDMGLVGGREREVRISSPPDDRANDVNPNDAQLVLEGGERTNRATNGDSTNSEGYVEVGSDEMNVDQAATSDASKNENATRPRSRTTDDDDTVIVDADGANHETGGSKPADESGTNMGADAADTTGQ